MPAADLSPAPPRAPRWRQRGGGFFRLIRLANVAMMALGAVIGGLLAAGAAAFEPGAVAPLALAALAAMAIGAGANAINDVFDLPIDRVNRPARPLPAGDVSPRGARLAWAALSLLGIVLAALVSWLHVAIAAASVGLLYVYSARLKRQPGTGNLAVAAVIGLALPFGGLAVLPAPALPGPLLAGALFAAVTTLAREVIKDVEDAPGDALEGARTLPVVMGVPAACAVAAGLTLASVAALPLALAAGLAPIFLPLAAPAAGLMLWAAWEILAARGAGDAARQSARARRASGAMKAAMLAGLAALAAVAW
jgi:geranylgeranylglycerol-phosphate geranylgeranyltransferase